MRALVIVAGLAVVAACSSEKQPDKTPAKSVAIDASAATKPAATRSPDAAPAPPACTDKAACLKQGFAHHPRGSAKLDFATAARYLDRACELGSAHGCHEAGANYAMGRGVGRDRAKAKTLMTKACRGEFGRACLSLGLLEASGSSAARGLFDLARQYFAKACKAGDDESCYWQVEVPNTPLTHERLTMLDRTCGGNIARACMYLANIVDRNNADVLRRNCPGGTKTGCLDRLPANVKDLVKKGYERRQLARGRLARLCNEGDLNSCRYLKDATQLRKHATAQCLAGSYGACQGISGQVDPPTAKQFLERACARGKLRESCDWLGDDYRDDAQRPDLTAAKRFYTKACDLGHLPACAKLKSRDLGGGCAALKPSPKNALLGAVPYAIPELNAVDLDGKPFRLSAHRGKVVVLFVTGSFHPKAAENLRQLGDLHKKLAGTKTQVVALVSSENLAPWVRTQLGTPQIQIVPDITTKGVGPLSNQVGVKLVPETMIIDAKGSVRVYVQNYVPLSSQSMQRCVRSLLP